MGKFTHTRTNQMADLACCRDLRPQRSALHLAGLTRTAATPVRTGRFRIGTPVYAPADGYIEFEQFWLTLDGSDNRWLMTAGGGLTVGVQADDGGPLFIVAHLSRRSSTEAQRVRKGQLIAPQLATLDGGQRLAAFPLRGQSRRGPPHHNNGTYGRSRPFPLLHRIPRIRRRRLARLAGSITTRPRRTNHARYEHVPEHPAYTGGPTISELFVDVKAACKKVDAIHEAILNNEGTNKSIVGGESLPSLTNKMT